MSDSWYKVDNVAKVFLATASMRDPRVFRISCTLQEQVDPDTLNEALRRTAQEWPQFQVTLHRGLFWHYFESTDLMPAAQPETKAPCAPLYTPERRNRLIYRVTYFGARINLEMFHAITDGNGGLLYLKSIVRNYLALRHPGELDSVPSPNSASAGDLAQDSFRNFYGGTRRRKTEKKTKVYRLHGFLPYDQLQFFEGHLSARQVLDRSHALGVSMTSYLGACFMLAIYHDMPALERSKPISISLPVNLRNYYPSETARNFFNSVYVTHTLTEADTLETVAPVFDAKLKEVLRPENIRAQMAELAQKRRSKQPLEYPSAGSMFKRPQGYFAAALIDQCGLKGFTVGGAQVSEKHAGFVINRGGATCADVLALVREVQRRVREQTGVELEMEVRRLG